VIHELGKLSHLQPCQLGAQEDGRLHDIAHQTKPQMSTTSHCHSRRMLLLAVTIGLPNAPSFAALARGLLLYTSSLASSMRRHAVPAMLADPYVQRLQGHASMLALPVHADTRYLWGPRGLIPFQPPCTCSH
jgi:hypothetical protein